MLRALIGLIKGLIVGGAVGYGLIELGAVAGIAAYAGCIVVGALVGVVCGRAPWRSETIWTPVVKAIVGGLIGLGLCALARHVPLPETRLFAFHGVDLRAGDAPVLAVVVGALYGMFVEIDDGGRSDKEKAPAGPKSLPR
jgi:hypothetical protein